MKGECQKTILGFETAFLYVIVTEIKLLPVSPAAILDFRHSA